MDFSFVPNRLVNVKDKIVKEHPLEAEELLDIKPNDKLFELVNRIASLEIKKVKMNAMSLSANDIAAIAAYLPHNYYSVKMRNLFLVFKYRTDYRLCEILYDQWQNTYTNKECNEFILDVLLKEKEDFIILLRNNHIDENHFRMFLEKGDIPTRYGYELRKVNFRKGLSLKDKLGYFGVKNSSKLYHDCEYLFYTFCDREDYLIANKLSMVDVVEKYSIRELKLFLFNFLSKLSLAELEDFSTLAAKLQVRIGDDQSSKFKSFFDGANPAIIRKYIDWINIYKVNKYFGNDERSIFWKRYRFVHVEKYSYSDSVVMEFDSYVAIEFLGQAMGPIYIYTKDYFNTYVRKWFTRKIYGNSEMRSVLLHQTDYQNYGYRKEHRGYWQSEVHGVLIGNNITEVVNKS